jgi:hypothetical protein
MNSKLTRVEGSNAAVALDFKLLLIRLVVRTIASIRWIAGSLSPVQTLHGTLHAASSSDPRGQIYPNGPVRSLMASPVSGARAAM